MQGGAVGLWNVEFLDAVMFADALAVCELLNAALEVGVLEY